MEQPLGSVNSSGDGGGCLVRMMVCEIRVAGGANHSHLFPATNPRFSLAGDGPKVRSLATMWAHPRTDHWSTVRARESGCAMTRDVWGRAKVLRRSNRRNPNRFRQPAHREPVSRRPVLADAGMVDLLRCFLAVSSGRRAFRRWLMTGSLASRLPKGKAGGLVCLPVATTSHDRANVVGHLPIPRRSRWNHRRRPPRRRILPAPRGNPHPRLSLPRLPHFRMIARLAQVLGESRVLVFVAPDQRSLPGRVRHDGACVVHEATETRLCVSPKTWFPLDRPSPLLLPGWKRILGRNHPNR